MRINHNIQALNAYRNLAQNQFHVSKNLERLSSGLRINRASDDAAGLAISEKMRSQIRGLQQAERNALDGVSLIQTAEGALNTTHSILQRMRELAVQSANGTLSNEDRGAIQSEIDQLTFEIDKISNNTQFNKKQLLAGDKEGLPFIQTDSADIAYNTTTKNSWEGIITAEPTEQAKIDIELDATFGEQDIAAVDGKTFVINGKTYEIDTDGTSDPNFIALDVAWVNGSTDANIDNTIDKLVEAVAANDPTFEINAADIAGADTANGTPGSLLLKTAEPMSPAKANAIEIEIPATGVTLKNPIDDSEITDNPANLIGDPNSAETKSTTLTLNYVPKIGDVLKIDGLTITFGEEFNNTVSGEVTLDVTDKNISGILTDISNVLTDELAKLDANGDPENVPALTSFEINGDSITLSTNKTDDGDTNGLDIAYIDQDFIDNIGKEISIQIQTGANEYENIEIKIGPVDAATLGLARDANRKNGDLFFPGMDAVKGISISTSKDAEEAISIINEAINKVSTERSRLGAYQNRLEHNINYLTIANENLTSAESRIRDVDMAMEMTEFTKNNILNQSAQAMLAQANQLPQGVLQLLN